MDPVSRDSRAIGLIIDRAQVTRQVHLLALAATTFTTRGKPDTQHAANMNEGMSSAVPIRGPNKKANEVQ